MIWASLITFWIVCLTITIFVGAKKGNPISAAFLGLILGPIAVLIVLLSEDKNRIACPLCAEKIQKIAKICPQCRSSVVDV